MTKSFVLYNVIEVEGELVDCIYLSDGACRAQPILSGTSGNFYKPNEQDQKDFCKNAAEFRACPRFQAYQNHLKKIGLEK